MNMHKNLYAFLLITSLFMVGCATSPNPDDTIDACKVTKPPINQDVFRAGDTFIYPNILNLPDNYTGCVKSWIGDNYKHSAPYHYFILGSEQFKNGHQIKKEGYEIDFSGKTMKVDRLCMYNEVDFKLMDDSSQDCPIYSISTIKKAKKYYLEQQKVYMEIEK